MIDAIQPDGVVVMPPLDHCAPLFAALKARGTRATYLAQREEFGRIVPGLDDAAFAEGATQKLVDLGHRQVGFVPGGSDPLRSQQRIEGYRRALAQVGSRAQRHFVCEAAQEAFSAEAQAKSWLAPTIRPTGIIAETAQAALAFAKVARELNIAVPDELSIIALEYVEALASAHPAISSMHLPYAELFTAALERLMDAESDSNEVAPGSAFVFSDRASTQKAPRAV